MHDRQARGSQGFVQLLSQCSHDDGGRERLLEPQFGVPVDPAERRLGVRISRVVHEQLRLPCRPLLFENEVEPRVEPFTGDSAQPMGGQPLEQRRWLAGIGFRQAEDVSFVELVLEEVREIAVTLVVRQRCSPRWIHEHRERCHVKSSRHVTHHGTKHRGREIQAAPDGLREDDVWIGGLQRVSGSQEVREPAAEAPAGHFFHG